MSLESLIADRPTLNETVADTEPEYVEAELNYIKPQSDKPHNYTYEPPAGIPRQNTVNEARRLKIRNGRSLAANLSLDQQGFAFISHRSAVTNFDDETEIRQIYFPEAEKFLKEVTGASRVLVFDFNLRNAQKLKAGETRFKEPVKRVHNDFTAKSGYRRSRDELVAIGVENPDEILQHRFNIINVWKPTGHPVQESPLAVCDARSIKPSDWVASDLIYRDRVGETYLTTYNESHQWFYFPHMQTDEVILIKCFDSAEDIPARFTAHTAFEDPTSLPNSIPRASIELRTLVIYEE
ncbi:CmcJ/NvfI family oxidoreductase [Pseudanabaena yagii]|uniref:CmcJ/NvfI family oxidoreductase n=1 Tax=Pseudanabaena yagii TaxID=2661615 RepID=UPI001CEC3D76|nr:CmcJ/NvfI family oxidoreductase [Pseudanabaena yagii]